MLSDRETQSLTVLDSMTGRDISCLWNCYSLFAQREFIEALQEFSENFQRSNESDWSVPGGYNCMLSGFTVFYQFCLSGLSLQHYVSMIFDKTVLVKKCTPW